MFQYLINPYKQFIKNKESSKALIYAAQKGNVETVKLLLDHGADVNATDEYNATALMYASAYGNARIVELLLECGADINVKNEEGDTALICAIKSSCVGKYMIFGQNPPVMAKILLNNKADVNLKNKQGDTALTVASKHGYTELVQLILANRNTI